MATIDWSELQDDLIGEIAKNIGVVEDFVSFARVCPSWRSAAVKENWVAAAPHQLPWLALVEKQAEQGYRRVFFNFKTNKRYELELPQLGPSRSFGSSLGWIVTLNMDLELHMINPLSRVKLKLPHLFTLEHMPRDRVLSLDPKHPDYLDPRYLVSYYIKKAFVCIRNQQLFVAAVYYGEPNHFAMARPGDESWSEVESVESFEPEDAVFVNGQLLVLNFNGDLGLCEFDWIHSPKLVTLVSTFSYIHYAYSHKAYLVEFMGDLLMVVRSFIGDNGEVSYRTTHFEIYKFDIQKKEWTGLENLGDMALFLGDSSSLSLSSTDLNCEGNAVYYTDDNHEEWGYIDEEYDGHDIGIFSLNDKTIRPLSPNLASDDLRSRLSCPFWLVPSLF